MFGLEKLGLVRKSVHDAAIAEKDAEIVRLVFELHRAERRARVSGRLAAEKVDECDRLRPDAEKYRRSRANLKQYRGSGAVAGNKGGASLNA